MYTVAVVTNPCRNQNWGLGLGRRLCSMSPAVRGTQTRGECKAVTLTILSLFSPSSPPLTLCTALRMRSSCYIIWIRHVTPEAHPESRPLVSVNLELSLPQLKLSWPGSDFHQARAPVIIGIYKVNRSQRNSVINLRVHDHPTSRITNPLPFLLHP